MLEPQNRCFERILAHYREQYEVQRPAAIASFEIAALAEHHSRENMSMLGFPTKIPGPQANEYVLLIDEPRFDIEAARRLESLVLAAEKELVRPDRHHAYTFLSAVVLCGSADQEALRALRKLKIRRDYYRSGWMVVRLVAVDGQGSMTANGDGADLKKLLQRAIKEPPMTTPESETIN